MKKLFTYSYKPLTALIAKSFKPIKFPSSSVSAVSGSSKPNIPITKPIALSIGEYNKSNKPPSPTVASHNCFNASAGSVNIVPTHVTTPVIVLKTVEIMSENNSLNEKFLSASELSSNPSLPRIKAIPFFNKSRGAPIKLFTSPVIPPLIPATNFSRNVSGISSPSSKSLPKKPL